MAKLRVLSGEELLGIFLHFGFQVVSQAGSHVKLRRLRADGTKQTLTIVLHAELDKGTLKAVYRQALRYVSESELRPWFYSE